MQNENGKNIKVIRLIQR